MSDASLDFKISRAGKVIHENLTLAQVAQGVAAKSRFRRSRAARARSASRSTQATSAPCWASAAAAAAVFHLFTHAFFKALLFLSAGSVMHAMGNVLDLRRIGGLRKLLPITHICFLVGALALAGLPPFSGFFSKENHSSPNFLPNFGFLYFFKLFTNGQCCFSRRVVFIYFFTMMHGQ